MKTYIKNYTNTFNIRGTEIEVTMPARFNAMTTSLVADAKLDDAAVACAQEKYRQKFDVIAPTAIKELRKKWHLSQREFAKIIGWSPSTVALYEAGEIPTVANNRLLKVLQKNDQTMQSFISESKIANLKEE
jgi:putative zinc finger/helix-turn-helix YgiT family protein